MIKRLSDTLSDLVKLIHFDEHLPLAVLALVELVEVAEGVREPYNGTCCTPDD